MFLSWIIPLYNCEAYISRCLDSILAQGLRDDEFEVIVINDGSSDSGPEIVKQYGLKYNNIKLFTQPNQGPGPARNYGISLAKGDYIHFVDADDFVFGNSIPRLKEYIENLPPDSRPQLCRVELSIVYDDDVLKAPVSYDSPITEASLLDLISDIGIHPGVYLWLMERKFVIDNNLQFLKINGGEDQHFMFQTMRYPHVRTLRCDGPCYGYFQRRESFMNLRTPEKYRRRISDFTEVYRLMKQCDFLNQYPKEIVDDFALTYLQCTVATNLLASKLPAAEIKTFYNKAIETGVLPIKSRKNSLVKILNLATRSWLTMVLAAIPYNYLYLPIIKRNRPV